MKRIISSMKILSTFLLFIIWGGACNKEDQFDHNRYKYVAVVERRDPDIVRDTGISINIKYDKCFFPYGEYPINIIYTLKNESKSVQYIMPPYGDLHLGNPQFTITTDYGDTLYPQNYEHRRILMNKYIRLLSRDSISFKGKIDFQYKFKIGMKYFIVATYYSRPVWIEDSLRKYESWSGYSESNILQYDCWYRF